MTPPRARRLAEATRSAVLDRRLDAPPAAPLVAAGITIPRAGGATIDVDGRPIHLTNLDRVLWPEAAFTKAELVAYVLAIAPAMLPHLRDRPLTLGRFPGGVDGRGFAQTDVPGRPGWLRATPLALASGRVRLFTLVDDRAGLAWLAQMGAIELHAFLARGEDTSRPGWVLFDLDPEPPAALLDAARVALALRDRLARDGLDAFVKTSGSAGLHVLVRAAPGATYRETRALASRYARELADAHPDRVTVAMRRDERGGRVLVDVRQNAERLTTIVPYSPRSTPRPTVSTPVAWDELDRAMIAGAERDLLFEPDEVVRRVAARGDLLAGVLA